MQSYLSSVVGIDTQSVVHGRPQQKELIESHTSMMSGRQLLAPKPPGSQLTDVSFQNKFGFTAKSSESTHSSITVADLSPAQEYEIRRQSRKRMYTQGWNSFFKGGIRDSNPVDVSTCLSRSPSRYLQALFKHEPDRQKTARMLYPDAFSEDNSDKCLTSERCLSTGSSKEPGDAIHLKDLVEPLVTLAQTTRARYAYQDAEPNEQGHCRVCQGVLQR